MLLVLTGRKVDGFFNNINAPFCGRKGAQSVLLPFSMVTVRRILCDYNPKWTTENLMMVHMLTGSVAKYLEELMEVDKTSADAMLQAAVVPSL